MLAMAMMSSMAVLEANTSKLVEVAIAFLDKEVAIAYLEMKTTICLMVEWVTMHCEEGLITIYS
jgi:hypothetical protein